MAALRQPHDAQAQLRHQRCSGKTDLRFHCLRSDRAKRQEPEGLFPGLERRRNREAEEAVGTVMKRLVSWQAKAPAPQTRKPLRTNVGQTLSSVNPVIVVISPKGKPPCAIA